MSEHKPGSGAAESLFETLSLLERKTRWLAEYTMVTTVLAVVTVTVLTMVPALLVVVSTASAALLAGVAALIVGSLSGVTAFSVQRVYSFRLRRSGFGESKKALVRLYVESVHEQVRAAKVGPSGGAEARVGDRNG